MNPPNQRETADSVLNILADQYCRSTLLYFQGTAENVISVRDLAIRIAPGEKTDETIVHLHHSTLPRLSDAGLVEYDSRSSTVRYHGDPDVEEIVEAVPDWFLMGGAVCQVGP